MTELILKCRSCGYIGPWKECCDSMNFGSATAEEAWQASRAAALEEAAKECELTQKHFDTQDAIDAAEQCAMAIRALKD